MLYQELRAEHDRLQRFATETKTRIDAAPTGRLHIEGPREKPTYFCPARSGDHSRTVISEEEARLLAQKEYDKKALVVAGKQCRAMEAAMAALAPRGLSGGESSTNAPLMGLYENLTLSRRDLVEPFEKPDEEYKRAWQRASDTTDAPPFEPTKFLSWRGEWMDCASEVNIAARLSAAGVCYHYKKSSRLGNGLTIRPSFTVLNVRTRRESYWQHLKALGDPEALALTLEWMQTMADNGIFPGEKLILSYETTASPMTIKQIDALIEHYCL